MFGDQSLSKVEVVHFGAHWKDFGHDFSPKKATQKARATAQACATATLPRAGCARDHAPKSKCPLIPCVHFSALGCTRMTGMAVEVKPAVKELCQEGTGHRGKGSKAGEGAVGSFCVCNLRCLSLHGPSAAAAHTWHRMAVGLGSLFLFPSPCEH